MLSFFLEGDARFVNAACFFPPSLSPPRFGFLGFAAGKWWSRSSLVRQKSYNTQGLSAKIHSHFMNFSRVKVETRELGQRIFLALPSHPLWVHAAFWRTQEDAKKGEPLGWLGHLQFRTSSHQADSSASFFVEVQLSWLGGLLILVNPVLVPCGSMVLINAALEEDNPGRLEKVLSSD